MVTHSHILTLIFLRYSIFLRTANLSTQFRCRMLIAGGSVAPTLPNPTVRLTPVGASAAAAVASAAAAAAASVLSTTVSASAAASGGSGATGSGTSCASPLVQLPLPHIKCEPSEYPGGVESSASAAQSAAHVQSQSQSQSQSAGHQSEPEPPVSASTSSSAPLLLDDELVFWVEKVRVSYGVCLCLCVCLLLRMEWTCLVSRAGRQQPSLQADRSAVQ